MTGILQCYHKRISLRCLNVKWAHILKAVSKSMKTLGDVKARFDDKMIINKLNGLKIIYYLDLVYGE